MLKQRILEIVFWSFLASYLTAMMFIFSSEQQQPYHNDNTKRHDVEQKPFWQKLFPDSTSFFNFSLVLVTGALVVIGITQANATKTAAEAAKQSADGLMDAERPHMILSELKIAGLRHPPDANGQIKLIEKVRITNYGRSPALLKSFASFICVDTELGPIPQYGSPRSLGWIFAPGHWFGNIAPMEILIPAATAAKIISDEEHVWSCIMVDYEDPFKRRHKTRAAYRVIFDAGNVSTHFYPDGPDSYWEYT